MTLTGANLRRWNEASMRFTELVTSKGGTVLGEYINANTKVFLRCKNDHEWEEFPGNIMSRNRWCYICKREEGGYKNMGATAKNNSFKRFSQLVSSKGGVVLGSYVGANNKILLRCKNNHEWEAYPTNIVSQNTWCGLCKREEAQALYQKKFEDAVYRKGGKILSKYIDSQTKVTVKCLVGHIWKVRPDIVRDDNGWCRDCNSGIELSKIKFEIGVLEQGGTILSNYTGDNAKVWLKCHLGHCWQTKPRNVKQGGGWCRICSESSLERKTRLFLEENNINYEKEYVLPQLPRKRFDYYFEYNNQKILIELDGEQHFRYEKMFHKSFDEYLHRQNIDRLKTRVAYDFGYKLIRIDYTQANNIKQHIINGILNSDWIYLSSRDKYLYLNDAIPNAFIIKNSPELAIKYDIKV